MNFKNIFMGMAICSLLFTVSCQNEELNGDEGVLNEKTTLIASLETPTPVKTRTQLGEAVSGITPVEWTKGDMIQVRTVKVNGRAASNFYELAKGSGTSIGTFQFVGMEAPGVPDFAVYPSNAIAGNPNNKTALPVRLLEYQNYVKDNISMQSNIAVANADVDGKLAFKNVCGILKVQLTGTATITQIVIKSNDVLSGIGKVDVTQAAPVVVMDEGGNKHVVLNCQTAETGIGVKLDATTSTNFYIVVPPTVSNSFTMEIASIDGILQKTTSENDANKFMRAKIINVPNQMYVANKTFGGIMGNTKYSPAFIAGKWWSPVNAGYQGDVVGTDHVRYDQASSPSACPEGWELPKKADLANLVVPESGPPTSLVPASYLTDVIGYYGNGGKGTWFGRKAIDYTDIAPAQIATTTAPMNCIWVPFTGFSGNAAGEIHTAYRSEEIGGALWMLGPDNENRVEFHDEYAPAAEIEAPVRCVLSN